MKHYFLILCLSLFSLSAMSQAKKPTLMVIPSDVWCTKNGYMEKFDNQGTMELSPNFQIALQTSSDLMNVISKINILMSDRDFPLKDLSQTLKSISSNAAQASVLTSTKSGAGLAENPIDVLKRTAKADIILELDWTVNTTGPKKSITYNLRGLDAYTGKQIAGAQGTGQPSFSAELSVLLEEAVLVNMDNFTAQLQKHFDDLLTNGREVIVDIAVFDNGSGLTLESEYDGSELIEVIENWVAQNTVSNRFNLSDASETFMLFEQVRIPLYRTNGIAMDTNAFGRELQKYLKAAPYNIDAKIINRGLGRVMLVLGEK